MQTIKLRGISKSFGEKNVLCGYHEEFPKESVSCIMGESGCGKTTLLRIMMGLERPDSGVISGVEGLRPAAVFQENRLCENLSALSNIKLVCSAHINRKHYEEAFEEVGLEDCLDKPVRELSGGMKRRVAILRAVLARPQIMYLDEPFKGLDDATYEQVAGYVSRQSAGVTVIMVSHDHRDAERMHAQRVIELLSSGSK